MKNYRISPPARPIADWLGGDPDYTRRAARTPALPLLGVLIGGGVSLMLWAALTLSACALFMR